MELKLLGETSEIFRYADDIPWMAGSEENLTHSFVKDERREWKS